MRKRVVPTLVLALIVLGCGSAQVLNEAEVPLLTDPNPSETCFTTWGGGPLTVHSQYGTAIDGTLVVAWPNGYTARRVGSEVEVLDRDGQTVATTGHRYRLTGGGVSRESMNWASLPEAGAFLACDDGVTLDE